MHDDEDGEVEHMSAHDLEAEQRLKLPKYRWIGVTFSNLHILPQRFTCSISPA